MKRLLTLLLAVVVLAPSQAVGADSVHVNGGGRGTVDGVTHFSQFGFGD
jgi:hypothetical protein